jgi:hypothetical protein
MPPGGDGDLHLHTREDESVHLVRILAAPELPTRN